MNKSLYLICIIFVLYSCNNNLYLPGYKQSTSITADGKLNDWNLPLKYGSEDGKYQYSITYDEKNIYIAVSSFDQFSQMSIIRSGIDFYFDISGKKSKSIHLHYPENKGDGFSVEGFQQLEAGSYSIQDPTTILAGMQVDEQKNLGIELIIPKSLITIDGKFKKNQINIGIAVAPFRMNRGEARNENNSRGNGMRESNMSGMGGMRGGFGGGGMRGGMGGGMRGGGMRGGNFGAETGLIGGKQSINWNSFLIN